MNNRFLLLPFLGIFSLDANALPLPQVAVAVSGVWQLYLVLTALLLVAFPVFKRVKHSRVVVSSFLIAVVLVVLGGAYYFMNSSKAGAIVPFEYRNEMFGTIPDDEVVPGLVWDIEDRKKDVNAISNLKAYELQKSGDTKYMFLDVRSNAETALGSAKGFTKVRWADFYSNLGNDLKGKEVIVSCWTGMRGSSVCAQLRAKGINCKYISGGLESWVNAGLPVELSKGVPIEQLGQASPSPNFNNFLTASAVVSSMTTGVNLVDIRYSSEYKKNPFPGSVNISFNELTVPALEESLKKLDKKPVAVLCYGSVSCGEATTFAWELDRLGIEFLGIYAGDKAYLEGAMNAGGITLPKSDKFLSAFIGVLDYLANVEKGIEKGIKIACSNLPGWLIFLLLCVPLSVLFYLSVSLGSSPMNDKGVTDKKFFNFLNEEDDVLALREKARGTKESLRNVMSTFVSLLIIFFIFWLMMPIASGFLGAELFGVKDLAADTGWSVLAFIAGTVLGNSAFVMLIADAKNKDYVEKLMSKRWWCFVVGGVILSTLMPKIFLLIAIATCVYVAIFSNYKSFVWYLKVEKAKNQLSGGWVNLSDVAYAMSYDNKASNLSVLMGMGYPVPNGFILTKENAGDIRKFKILNLLKGKVGVRSTLEGEDGLTESFAGCYKSVMPVAEGEGQLEAAIAAVFASYGDKCSSNSVVLVQECVDAVVSGTLFSKHPNWGGMLLVEWGAGLSAKRNDGTEDSHMGVYFRNGFDLAWNSSGAFSESSEMGVDTLKILLMGL